MLYDSKGSRAHRLNARCTLVYLQWLKKISSGASKLPTPHSKTMIHSYIEVRNMEIFEMATYKTY
jgi:hypothetical protein